MHRILQSDWLLYAHAQNLATRTRADIKLKLYLLRDNTIIIIVNYERDISKVPIHYE